MFLKELLAGKIKDIDTAEDKDNFNTEVLQAIRILTTKLADPFLHEVNMCCK